jgi:hypothetical protein
MAQGRNEFYELHILLDSGQLKDNATYLHLTNLSTSNEQPTKIII